METKYHPEKCMYNECAYPFVTCTNCIANVNVKNTNQRPKFDAHAYYKFVRKLFRHPRNLKQ